MRSATSAAIRSTSSFVKAVTKLSAFYGTFDRTDEVSAPDFRRFVLEGEGAVLSGDSQSIVYTLLCCRVFGVGSPDLLESIGRSSTQADAVDLTEGVRFFDDDSVMAGTAPAFEALLGAAFPCGALLVIRLEFDDFGPDSFRVDFELIPSATER